MRTHSFPNGLASNVQRGERLTWAVDDTHHRARLVPFLEAHLLNSAQPTTGRFHLELEVAATVAAGEVRVAGGRHLTAPAFADHQVGHGLERLQDGCDDCGFARRGRSSHRRPPESFGSTSRLKRSRTSRAWKKPISTA